MQNYHEVKFENHTQFILALLYKILKFIFHTKWHFCLTKDKLLNSLVLQLHWNGIHPRCLTRKNSAKEGNHKPLREL